MPTYATNKIARFDYEILEELEAGLVLSGQETKSVRGGGANMKGSFVQFHNGTALLTNMHISKYPYAGTVTDYDPTRSRQLLLHGKEIDYLQGKKQENGLTIVPLSLYSRGRLIKVKLGVARGKKRHDKKQTLKERDIQRDAARDARDALGR